LEVHGGLGPNAVGLDVYPGIWQRMQLARLVTRDFSGAQFGNLSRNLKKVIPSLNNKKAFISKILAVMENTPLKVLTP